MGGFMNYRTSPDQSDGFVSPLPMKITRNLQSDSPNYDVARRERVATIFVTISPCIYVDILSLAELITKA